MNDGYSGKPLVDKLGIKPDTNMAVMNAPDHYDELIGAWPIGTSVSRSTSLTISNRKLDEEFSFIHYFATRVEELERDFADLAAHLTKKGALWISWPKGGSTIPNDLSENIIREVGLLNGLVDVKVVAVDEDWSGLKFVYRLKDR